MRRAAGEPASASSIIKKEGKKRAHSKEADRSSETSDDRER
jgi:hypothetical protein